MQYTLLNNNGNGKPPAQEALVIRNQGHAAITHLNQPFAMGPVIVAVLFQPAM